MENDKKRKFIRAEGSFLRIFLGFILAGLFLVALVSFNVGFSRDNNTNLSIIKDPYMNETFYNINSTITDATGDVKASLNATESAPISEDAKDSQITAIWGNLKTMWSIVKASANILIDLLEVIGVGEIVLITLIAIVGFILLLYAWKTWRSGE